SISRSPMTPLAPGLFSTITGWPNFARSPSATSRADRSVMPAGGNGTISRIGREGKLCAAAAADSRRQERKASSARNLFPPPFFVMAELGPDMTPLLFRPQVEADLLVDELQRISLVERNRRLDHAHAHHLVVEALHARVGHGADAERRGIAGIDDAVLLHLCDRKGQELVGHFRVVALDQD